MLRPEGKSERAIFVIDKIGMIRYVDVHDIDEQPDNEVLFQELAKLEPAGLRREPVVVGPFIEPEADVVLYGTVWCPASRKARAYLERRKIPFVEINISTNRAAAHRVREWAGGYETTPTLKIRGQVVVGFDEKKLDKIFG